MAIRTYQKRGGNNNTKTSSKDVVALPLPAPPLAIPSVNLSTKESTPLWHRWRKGLESDDSDGENSPSGDQSTAGNAQPVRAFIKDFRKGATEDRNHLENWCISGDMPSERAECVPGDWSLTRQMRFGAWCQLLGLPCRWEGGYLWVTLSRKACEDVRWASSKENLGVDVSSPLPAAPPRAATDNGQFGDAAQFIELG